MTSRAGGAAGVRPPARAGPLVVAVAAAVLPVVVAGLRAAFGDWRPTSDNVFVAMRASDVLSVHPPLLGTSSSLGEAVGRDIHHPGALNFDLLALPVHLFGHRAGTAVGVALINCLAIAGLAWLLRRRLGPGPATVGLAAVALLVWSMGSQVLIDPWHTHATLLSFALVLVAAWCAAAGEPAAFPVLVVSGSFVVQYHLSYVVPVLALTVFVAAVGVVRVVRARRQAASWPQRRRRIVRWGVVTLVTGVVCWLQPLVQQVGSQGEGNLVALFRASRVSLASPSVSDAVTVLGSSVALPPFFLPPSFASPSFRPDASGRPWPVAALGLVALVWLLATLGRRAWRRGHHDLAWGAATAVVGLAAGVVTVDRMPVIFGVVTFYLRWMWPLGMMVWLVVVLGLADEVATWLQERRRPRGRAVDDGPDAPPRFRLGMRPAGGGAAVVWAAAVLALVAGLFAVPAADNGSMSPAWSITAANEIAPEVVATVEDEEQVIVDLPVNWPVIHAGPPLLAELQEAGIPFLVEQRIVARHAGVHYQAEPDDTGVHINVRPGTAEPEDGERLVASWSSLPSSELEELDRLTGVLAEAIDGRGVELHPEAAAVIEELSLESDRDALEAAADDPEALLAGPALWSFVRGAPAEHVGHSLVDESTFPPGVLARWAELAEQRDREQVEVYLSERR